MNYKMLVSLCVVSSSALIGCTAVPQAGLIYGSTVLAGVGLKVSTADTTAPVDISIGFKTHDLAYVPVAVSSDPKSNGGGIVKVWGSHNRSDGERDKCEAENNKVADKSGDQIAAKERSAIDDACDTKRDAMSVYGQFDGLGKASGNDRSAGLTVGRIFSTGIAAQNVSLAARNLAHAECVKSVAGVFPTTAKPEDVFAAIKANCALK